MTISHSTEIAHLHLHAHLPRAQVPGSAGVVAAMLLLAMTGGYYGI